MASRKSIGTSNSNSTLWQMLFLLSSLSSQWGAGWDNILFHIIRRPLRIPVRPKNVTSHPVGSVHVLTTPQHKKQIMLLCSHNTFHLQRFLVPNPTVLRPLTKKYIRACSHCQCSPVKDIHQHDTLLYCVIACPLLHQHASTLLAWTPC